MNDTSDDDDNNVNHKHFSSNRNSNPHYEPPHDNNSRDHLVSQYMEAMLSHEKKETHENFRELFLPGVIIHIILDKKNNDVPLYRRWKSTLTTQCGYEAYVAKKEAFMDLIVSPSRFIDHLPWR